MLGHVEKANEFSDSNSDSDSDSDYSFNADDDVEALRYYVKHLKE